MYNHCEFVLSTASVGIGVAITNTFNSQKCTKQIAYKKHKYLPFNKTAQKLAFSLS